MLRVSEFCRGPLSPVPPPSSGGSGVNGDSRRAQKDVEEEAGHAGDSIYSPVGSRSNDEGDGDVWGPSIPSKDCHAEIENARETDAEDDYLSPIESKGCRVRLCPMAHESTRSKSSASSSSVLRVPLDVLKSLSLRDGDIAVIEAHRTVESGINNDGDGMDASRTRITCNSLLHSVVIRLELMDEDEEEKFVLPESQASSCLAPPVVLANLGISPSTLWKQPNRTPASFGHPGWALDEPGVTFRLCSIPEVEKESFASPWPAPPRSGRSRSIPRRRFTAGRVLLRPLGRASLWPYFDLQPSDEPDSGDESLPQHPAQPSETDKDASNHAEGNASSSQPNAVPAAESRATGSNRNSGTNDHGNDDACWIYPSRAGTILQESTLCEVRYDAQRSTTTTSQPTNVCYYEVLRIEKSNGQGEKTENKIGEGTVEEGNNVEWDDKDDCFYVSTADTQFELDSRPLSNLSHVRRLPLPVLSASRSKDPPDDAARETKSREEDAAESGHTALPIPREETNGLRVLPRRLFASPQAPPRTHLHPSDDKTDTDDEKSATEDDDNEFLRHPDWKTVANALLDAPAMGSQEDNTRSDAFSLDAASRILHLVGTDRDHDLQACVATAASLVGMSCLSVRGLAAFGYEHRRSHGSNDHRVSSRNGVTVRSAAVEQQLAGIEAAFETVRQRRMEPCVVHFGDVDRELASCAADDQLRCQIQDRFWSKWTEGVATQTGSGSPTDEEKDWVRRRRSQGTGFGTRNDEWGLDYRYTPRILIVISSKAPLKKGPWLERLVFPTIKLSLPNDGYIRYLWRKACAGDSGEANSESKDDVNHRLTNEMMPLLRGRSVHEIIHIRQQISFGKMGDIAEECSDDSNNRESNNLSRSDGFQNLENVCQDFDASKRKGSSDVARISRVSWEDVGGLDHVRAEIMDAIELPLKHPHLFPPNAGRSGILLFGPPGTGKTLVAKAVATECGLPFLSVKGPELLGSYIGESEANIRRVFASARLAAKNNLPHQASILFFDELDSLAPKRGGTNHGGGVMERVVASLLAEFDGGHHHKESSSSRVFVLGATNRPDLLDPSLLRPGRLDRLVYLGIPTNDHERTRVLAAQLHKMKLDGNAMDMARSVVEGGLPPRLSGADMSKLSSGAMTHAIRRLCLQAEREREERIREQTFESGSSYDKGIEVTIDEILEGWGKDRCTPLITLDDLRLASRDVSPSVTEEELQRYERLRTVHQTGSAGTV